MRWRGERWRKSLQCIVRLNAHRRGTQRESPILAQQYYSSAEISTTMAARSYQLCAIDLSAATQYPVNLIVALTSHEINACVCFIK